MLPHQFIRSSEIHIVKDLQLRDTQQEVKILFMLMLCPQDNVNDNVNVTSSARSSDKHIDIVTLTHNLTESRLL